MKIAAVGLTHAHIYGQVNCLLRAGAEIVAFHETDEALAAAFAKTFPQAKRVADPAAILEDEGVAVVLTSAVPADRAAIALAAMRHGKDVLSDKPGMTTLDDLAELRRVQAETGRILGILYSEHFEVPATVRAGELVAEGAIGEVVHTTGLGPHRLRAPTRAPYFFERARYGGILTDIASHQVEQFLFFTGDRETRVLSASVANRANPETPGLQDVGDMHLATDGATGMIRVDWFTPDGLPTWGDGRLIIVGTTGTIELRKYLDIAGRPGGDHLFIADKQGVRHIDCSGTDLPFGRQFLADVRDRTETAIPQSRVFDAMEITIKAQMLAEETSGWGGA